MKIFATVFTFFFLFFYFQKKTPFGALVGVGGVPLRVCGADADDFSLLEF